MNIDKINETEIPEEIEVTLYTTIQIRSEWDHNLGQISTHVFKRSSNETEEFLVLHEETITLKLGKMKIDLRGEIIKGLEGQKTSAMANHEVVMNCIQDKIDSLTAIEYHPANDEEKESA